MALERIAKKTISKYTHFRNREITLHHRMKILQFLLENGNSERKRIHEELAIKTTTVFDNLSVLEKHGFVSRYPVNNGGRGRPRVFWKITQKGREEVKLSNV